jgi:hypothetical protein
MDLLGDRHAAEDTPPGGSGGGRRQSWQAETGEAAGAQHAAEDGDAEGATSLVDRSAREIGGSATLSTVPSTPTASMAS